MKKIQIPLIPSKEFSTLSHRKDCSIHKHTNCELLLILSGSADNIVDKMKVSAVAGDLFFINDRVNHTLIKTSESYSHRDIYISSHNLQEICSEFFDLDFFKYLMSTNKIIQIPISPELFFSYTERLQRLQTAADLSNQQKDFSKKAIRVIIISLLGILYEQKQEKIFENAQSWIQDFLIKIQSPDIFTLPIDEIIKLSNYSHTYFSHQFKNTFQISFKTYINKLKMRYAKTLLNDPQHSIADIAYICGYSNQSHFTQRFKETTGETPNQYRKKLFNSSPTQILP